MNSSRQSDNKFLLVCVIIFQHMLQCSRFKNLQDLEQIRFRQLMESIPNSIGEISESNNKSKKTLKQQSATAQLTQNRKRVKRTSLTNNCKSNESQPDAQSNNMQSFYDRSSRSLFPIAKTAQFSGSAISCDTRLECSSNDASDQPKLESSLLLKEIIKKYKIKSIVSNFIRKIKRISISNKPVQLGREGDLNKGLLWRKACIQLPQFAQNILSLLSIIQVFVVSIVVSMSFVFAPLRQSEFINNMQIISLLISFCQLFQNLFTVRSNSGKKLRVLNQIWQSYAQGSLMTDVITFLIVLLNCFILNKYFLYLESVFFLKLPHAFDKIQRLEVYWIKNFYNQQYWSLIKIIISNFCFAHIISIMLAGMTNFSPNQNWMTSKEIWDAEWEVQYIWSYYWASTMMLTIGFGDIVASNYKEALCLIFIQTFSCLVFAYNINCIGTLIQHIRSQDAQKSKRSKIFKKLTKQNRLNQQLSWKINNYIEQNAELRKRFNFEQQKEFIGNLPVELKKQYLKESNRKIFQHIEFFKSFISKTLYNLAERIEMRVSHPDEVIQKIDDDYNLIILKQGQIGYFCKKTSFNLKDFVMNVKTIQENDKPYLLNLDFIVKKRPYYEIRSIYYCIFFFLGYDNFVEAVKDSAMDYEYYCGLRDKMKNIPDEFELMNCETCDSKHLKAMCPRLHFIPYNQTIIHKYLYREKTSRNENYYVQRKRKHKANAFKVYKVAIMHVQKLGAMLNTKRRRTKSEFSSNSDQESDCKLPSNAKIQVQREIRRIQEKYMNITYEIIKEEINKMKKSDYQEDEVWILKLDKLHDFNGYFSKDNPVNISTKTFQQTQSFNKDNPMNGTAIIQQIRQAFSSQHHEHARQSRKKTVKINTR